MLGWSAMMACSDSNGPSVTMAPPDSVRAVAVGPGAVRVEWAHVEGASSYRLERRGSLSGRFRTIAEPVPSQGDAQVSYFDTDVEPETFYGYRVVALSSFGGRSAVSTVAGDRTPPAPGVLVTVRTNAPTVAAVDRDGYTVTVRREADSTTAVVGPNASRRFSPLAPGTYAVTLRGVAPNCAARATQVAASVPSEGVQTLVPATFDIDCLDATRARIVALVTVEGDAGDANGFQLALAGLAADATLPDSVRAVARRQKVGATGGATRFEDLRPGHYDLRLEDVQAPCAAGDGVTRTVTAAALRTDTVRFTVRCEATGGGADRPLVLRNLWAPRQAPTGAKVALTVSLDLAAQAGLTLGSAAGRVQFPAAVLRYDSVTALRFPGQSVNSGIAGELNWIAFATSLDNPPSGIVPLLRFHFTVTGATGTSAATRSRVTELLAGDAATAIDTALVRPLEDTLVVGAGSGGTNAPPVARANGPYTGTTTTPIAFSSAGSSDADGTIASWFWSFGDGATSTLPNPSRTYTAAGSYTAMLTVTDDDGATASGQAVVTVTSGGSGNQPPQARANGPYAGTVAMPIAFSSAGSTDTDGSVVAWQWAFGDGTTSTQANPAKSYATAGSYTATLTVTDDRGASASASAPVTVTADGGTGSTPFTWAGGFGAVNQADSTVRLTITLDLTTNIPETPGIEELESFVVDSLRWDPTVLRFWALNWGPGSGGSFQTFGSSVGKLALRSSTLPSQNRSGVVTVAVVTFKLVGATGRATTTQTALGALVGTSQTGGFSYRTRTRVQEATITTP